MALPKSIRLRKDLEEKVAEYLDENDIKFPHLVNLAIEKFIEEPQTITLKPVESKEWMKTAKKAFKKHKNAMDKLK